MIDENLLIKKLYKIKNKSIKSNKVGASNIAYVIEKVIEIIKRESKIGEWIPCSERLPKHDGNYLIQAINDCEGIYMAVSNYDSQYKSFSSDGVDDDNAIAWMNLPKMYEVRENERP